MDEKYDKAISESPVHKGVKDEAEFWLFVELIELAFDKNPGEIAYDLMESRFYEGSTMG